MAIIPVFVFRVDLFRRTGRGGGGFDFGGFAGVRAGGVEDDAGAFPGFDALQLQGRWGAIQIILADNLALLESLGKSGLTAK